MPKLTLEFNDRMNKILQDLAVHDDTTKVEVLRRALALYKYVIDETEKGSDRGLGIIEDDKVIKEIVLAKPAGS